jgi:hypothetical protein
MTDPGYWPVSIFNHHSAAGSSIHVFEPNPISEPITVGNI